MLITEKEIRPRFLKHLSWATEIDIATAWTTSNKALCALQQRAPAPEVRAIVGLWGNLTDPFALRMLANIGQLRGADSTRRFHPKVFLFRDGERQVAWVGSANFTSGGFGMNEEAMFETHDTQSVQSWFDHLWEYCNPLDGDAIDVYAESRDKSRKNSPPPLRPAKPPNLSPMQLLEKTNDWPSYVAALEQCDVWWSSRHSWSVLGDHSSWRETVEVLHDMIRQQDWNKLDKYDRNRLLGSTRDEGWALLGRMWHTARNTVFGDRREEIQNIVHTVLDAEDAAFPQLAFESYAALWEIYGVGSGIATRLLTLARPDRFVSLNKASRAGLAKFSRLKPTTLDKPSNYALLLTAIYDQDWYTAPIPGNMRERAIFQMRVALLDSFVYDHKKG